MGAIRIFDDDRTIVALISARMRDLDYLVPMSLACAASPDGHFVGTLYGMGYFSRRQRVEYALDPVELRDVCRRLTSQLSGGMQRRSELACALVHDPLLLFADEPTAGIDCISMHPKGCDARRSAARTSRWYRGGI